MTNIEFYLDITLIVLLIPTIIYASYLSVKLKEINRNQETLLELARTFHHTVKNYDNQHTDRTENRLCEPHFYSVTEQISAEPSLKPLTENDEPHFEKKSVPLTEEPSEAELELLQALRSIK